MRWIMIVCLALCGAGCQEDGGSGSDGGTVTFDAGPDGSADGGTQVIIDPGPEAEPEGMPACSADDYEEQIITFCRTQTPGAPEPRSLGAQCQGDAQCDSGECRFDVCMIECPRGDECPIGFACQDVGTDTPACRETVCIYGGSTFDDCLREMNDQFDAACRPGSEPGCEDDAEAWLACLNDHGRICSNVEAGDACGVERVRLERCCIFCGGDW